MVPFLRRYSFHPSASWRTAGSCLSNSGSHCLYRLPHYIEVDVEIAVSHAVVHIAHVAPRHVGMRLSERDIAIHHLRRSLADDDKAHDDGLLGALVGQEVVPGHPFHEAACICCGLLDVVADRLSPITWHPAAHRPTGQGRCHPGRCHAAPNRRRADSPCESGSPLRALHFASCQAQRTVAWASFLLETHCNGKGSRITFQELFSRIATP
jgi:hypothetical protein